MLFCVGDGFLVLHVESDCFGLVLDKFLEVVVAGTLQEQVSVFEELGLVLELNVPPIILFRLLFFYDFRVVFLLVF